MVSRKTHLFNLFEKTSIYKIPQGNWKPSENDLSQCFLLKTEVIASYFYTQNIPITSYLINSKDWFRVVGCGQIYHEQRSLVRYSPRGCRARHNWSNLPHTQSQGTGLQGRVGEGVDGDRAVSYSHITKWLTVSQGFCTLFYWKRGTLRSSWVVNINGQVCVLGKKYGSTYRIDSRSERQDASKKLSPSKMSLKIWPVGLP